MSLFRRKDVASLQAELATIPNSNHDAVVRSPQAFAALLMPFLARH